MCGNPDAQPAVHLQWAQHSATVMSHVVMQCRLSRCSYSIAGSNVACSAHSRRVGDGGWHCPRTSTASHQVRRRLRCTAMVTARGSHAAPAALLALAWSQRGVLLPALCAVARRPYAGGTVLLLRTRLGSVASPSGHFKLHCMRVERFVLTLTASARYLAKFN